MKISRDLTLKREREGGGLIAGFIGRRLRQSANEGRKDKSRARSDGGEGLIN